MNNDPNMQPVVYQSPPQGSGWNPLRRLSMLSPKIKFAALLLAVLVLLGGIGLVIAHRPTHKTAVVTPAKQTSTNTNTATQTPAAPKITTFAECKTSTGSTLSQTTPQTCTTSTGQSFTDPTPVTKAVVPTKQPTATATPSAPAASGGTGSTTPVATLNCSNPIFTSSWPQTQYGGWQGPNNSRVNANVLTGSGGGNSQVLNVCSETNWNVVAKFTDNGGSINTYPDTQYDLTTDKTISQYTSLNTCFGSVPPTPSGPQWPTAGGSEWDYAYDVWINHTSGENIWSNDIEIMVWNNWTDNIYPPAVGSVASGGSRAVTIDGVAYHMFQGGGGNEWIYTRDTKANSGCFDMLNIMKDLVANESTAAGITLSSAPQHIEYGVEIAGTYGTQTFQITNASLAVN